MDLANFPAAMVAAIILGLVNGGIRPILQILSLPVTILTLGIFALVVNGICFWLASVLVPGFTVHGFLALILKLGKPGQRYPPRGETPHRTFR